MKTKFLEYCIGVAVVLVAAGFLIRSISPAEAGMPRPEKFLDGSVPQGKYMMSISESVVDKEVNVHFLVWNTETGQSKIYERIGPNPIEVLISQLPVKPLGN